VALAAIPRNTHVEGKAIRSSRRARTARDVLAEDVLGDVGLDRPAPAPMSSSPEYVAAVSAAVVL
jgi:hypothetical protein